MRDCGTGRWVCAEATASNAQSTATATKRDRQIQGIKNRFLPHNGDVVLKTYSLSCKQILSWSWRCVKLSCVSMSTTLVGELLKSEKAAPGKSAASFIRVARLLDRQSHLGAVNKAARYRRYCVAVSACGGVCRRGRIGRWGCRRRRTASASNSSHCSYR